LRLSGQLVEAADVTPAQREAMFALMVRHYANVRREAFDADLNDKRWVIQLSNPATGRLCGFSTQVLVETVVGSRPVKALFSGDTVVDRDHWGDSSLAHVWGRLALSLIDAHDGTDLYWFLVSKGYRTYRFLPVFFREFYPRNDRPTPPAAMQALDTLARCRFATRYDAEAGLIRAQSQHDRLRRGVAEITPARLRDPHVRYFVERNPGHAQGDELCCLAPLARSNFTPAAWRVIEAGSVVPA
jgi:hypothetical protein